MDKEKFSIMYLIDICLDKDKDLSYLVNAIRDIQTHIIEILGIEEANFYLHVLKNKIREMSADDGSLFGEYVKISQAVNAVLLKIDSYNNEGEIKW